MLNDLTYFDNSIVGRYRTVERNIKSKSNSFFDSYLDLLENTIKRILEMEEVEYDEKLTCGTLLRKEEIANYFKRAIGVEEHTFSKCQDYIAKVNKHKHFNEHRVTIDIVVTYMKVYYDLVSAYLAFKGKEHSPFSADYFNSIYGLAERENGQLRGEVERLRADLESLALENKLSVEDNETFRSLVSAQEMANLSLEEQNTELRNQLSKLKDIKINTIELKLNKALELLYNLTDSVVESRAIGIAVGKSITGQDITKTNFMRDAVEIVKKKESVAEMLGRQGEDISTLSSKFSGMEIDDLYRAAKQHWDAENYKVAEQYYEKICLLRPLDWRAPFYAGLCKTKGSFNISYYVDGVFPRVGKAFNVAIEQIKMIGNSSEQTEAVKEVFGLAVKFCQDNMPAFLDTIRKLKSISFEKEMKTAFIFPFQIFVARLLKELAFFEENEDYKVIRKDLSNCFVKAVKEADKGYCDPSINEEDFHFYIKHSDIEDKPPYKPRPSVS